MTSKMLDDVRKLMSLSDDELNDVLLEEKYNKANLRELVRRTVKVANEYKKAFEYEKYDRKDTEELLRLYDGNEN